MSDSGLEALYPFLYDGAFDIDAVLETVRESTVTKVAETSELRASVVRDNADLLISCATEMAARFAAGGRMWTCGNGGSSTDAQDLASLFLHPSSGRPLPSVSLTSDIAVITALANDIGFDVVFSRQVAAFAEPSDIVFGLSTSGNSPNLIRVFREASQRGLMTIGLAGYGGGAMAELDSIDALFTVPSESIHRIQESQTTLYHLLWELCQGALEEAV